MEFYRRHLGGCFGFSSIHQLYPHRGNKASHLTVDPGILLPVYTLKLASPLFRQGWHSPVLWYNSFEIYQQTHLFPTLLHYLGHIIPILPRVHCLYVGSIKSIRRVQNKSFPPVLICKYIITFHCFYGIFMCRLDIQIVPPLLLLLILSFNFISD